MIDKRTGEESDVNFDVCNLHVENQPENSVKSHTNVCCDSGVKFKAAHIE
jgi:hypothetical protein